MTRDKAVAWELAVFNSGATVGGACDDDAEASPVGGDGPCDRQINLGWKAYSVERFYTAPVVYGVERVSSSTKAALAATCHAALKRQHPSPGTWALLDRSGASLATGAFAFRAHQLPTTLRVPFHTPGPSFDPATLRVTDEWGQHADVALDSH